MRGLLALSLLGLAAGPALGQVMSTAPERASVTIYRDAVTDTDALAEMDPSEGLAMITETRTVDVPAGRSRISFRGVADTMVAETAAVEGVPGQVIERNEDFNLLSPGSLVESAVGETVRLVRTNRITGEVVERPAVIRAGAGGVVLEVDGRIEALGCSGQPERLVFARAPASLSDNPTLSMLADVPTAGRYTVKLSYLATGFSWAADYVARIRPDGRTLDLIGWLTLANRSSAGFADAPTDVVAGDLSRDESTQPMEASAIGLTKDCWGRLRAPEVQFASMPVAPAPPMMAYRSDSVEEIVVTAQKVAKQSDLGDYKLYTLPEPTTVAARQTKQVLFLQQAGVPFERVYIYRQTDDEFDFGEDEPDAPTIILRLQNEVAAGLGKPLPAGTVAVMETSPGGAPVLAGEQAIEDTPAGLPLEIELGRAVDVSVTPRVVSVTEVRDLQERIAVAVEIANAKPIPVVVEYRHAANGDDLKIVRSSQRHAMRSGDPMWIVRVPAGGRSELTYTMERRD